jgi:hypothetical protein
MILAFQGIMKLYASGKAFSWDAGPGWACKDVMAVAYGMDSFLFFRFRMMDTPNFIDFFHLEAGRDRYGKIAACEGICWLLGRINP